MISLTTMVTFVTEISVLLGVVVGIVVFFKKIADGVKCLLRSKMLEIYYRNRDNKSIRQYEKENFLLLYAAYKALKGNSFIDDIAKEVRTWTVIS